LNRYVVTLLFFSFASFCGDSAVEVTNPLVAAVTHQVNKIAKKPIHKSPVEYRQAVERYIVATKAHFLSSHIGSGKGKMASYEIELQYLLNNYGRFSTATLLSRLRSAHHEMVKINYDTHNEKYQYYEQICSALLLQCAQMLSDNARKQLLDALHEVDDLIIYWRYQKNHPFSYCFHKSPLKWITGKSQENEVSSNIKRLERKQAELYTSLGKLTAHAHYFTECGMTYAECYTWIEELFSVLACIKTTGFEKTTDGTRFDLIAAQLESKTKSVGNLKYHCLHSIASAKKSNHFVRNWIAYTTALAASAYAVHYYVHNYGMVNKLIGDRSGSLYKNWGDYVVGPSKDVWNVVSGEASDNRSVLEEIKADIKTLEVQEGVNKETSNKLNNYLKVDHEKTQVKMKSLLDKFVTEGAWFYRRDEKNNETAYQLSQEDINKIISGESDGDVTGFQQLIFDMPANLIGDLVRKDDFIKSVVVIAELYIYHYGSSLIAVVFQLIVDYGMPVVKEVLGILLRGNKKVDLILNVAVLTPTIIVGGCTAYGLNKTYQRMTARDYSPIRIALADVNSLLIESPMPLDDYDYGKLVYLVHKLRNKASSLKDALCNEFLADVTKLESKRFDVAAKRGIVDNMFNKYAFLGRIAA
jgi:hypothetical protein